MKTQILLLAATTLTVTAQAADVDTNWQSRAIAPVVNPIFFETALIQSEVRPLFAYHNFDKDFLGADVNAQVYAVQLRYAVNDRLAIIATKDGYMTLNGDVDQEGWNDISAGVKYAIYKNDEKQLIITPGLTFDIPIGDDEVFQGNGDGEFNVFVSAIKGWGNLHLSANIGARIPIDMDEETSSFRTAFMLDYYTCQWFIPFVTLNTFTTLNDADELPFHEEGFDVVNFGATSAGGRTQAAAGVGFRTRLHRNVDFGFAYEYGFLPDDDIFKDRYTVDFIVRF
jgi:hypothetical protein